MNAAIPTVLRQSDEDKLIQGEERIYNSSQHMEWKQGYHVLFCCNDCNSQHRLYPLKGLNVMGEDRSETEAAASRRRMGTSASVHPRKIDLNIIQPQGLKKPNERLQHPGGTETKNVFYTSCGIALHCFISALVLTALETVVFIWRKKERTLSLP